MKVFVVLAAIFAVVHFVNSDKLLQALEDPEQYKNIPRQFSDGQDKGLFQVKSFNSIKDKDITFHVYTQARASKSNDIKASQVNDLLRLTGFNTSKDTLVIIHGWTHNHKSPPNALIRPAALRNRDINVIAVDWSPISVQVYSVAQKAVEKIGHFVGDFLNKLAQVHGYDLNRITIVGHSLGAHLAGCAGARTRGRINTIVGLDPAGIPYVASNIHNRLDPTDAKFVQVIVSSSIPPKFSMGHTTYFPNGGLAQPGCGIDPLVVCSHTRSVEYYAESLKTANKFRAKRCTTWTNYQMGMCMANGESFMGGLPVQKAASGTYFLSTNSKALFAKG